MYCIDAPKRLISGLANNPNCFEIAKARLDKEYSNVTRAIRELGRSVTNGPRVCSGDLKSWSDFVYEVENYHSILVSYGREHDVHNTSYIEQIAKRLPRNEFKAWITLYRKSPTKAENLPLMTC